MAWDLFVKPLWGWLTLAILLLIALVLSFLTNSASSAVVSAFQPRGPQLNLSGVVIGAIPQWIGLIIIVAVWGKLQRGSFRAPFTRERNFFESSDIAALTIQLTRRSAARWMRLAWMPAFCVRRSSSKPAAAARLAERLTTGIDPIVRESFGHWWQTGSLEPTLEVEGYSVPRLMAEFGLNPFAAFSTLDGLKTEPERTLDTLRRGFDRRRPPVQTQSNGQGAS